MERFKKALLPVLIFAKIDIKRSFRDKIALFFIFLFPLIFLFVFGGIFGKSDNLSFDVAIINHSGSEFSKDFVKDSSKEKVFKINKEVTTLDQAKQKMNRSELDAAIVLPSDFGVVKNQKYPSGQAIVYYTKNNEQAGRTLVSILEGVFKGINTRFVPTETPFSVKAQSTDAKSLSPLDYIFSGLVGFSILGLGIFGPTSVFPQLKKNRVLRRLNTTPLRVWQYFSANVISQAFVGLISIAILFAAAKLVFNVNMYGSFLDLGIFVVLSIITIFGIGLAVGGWAKNETQAAPLANLITFPMMFLSGTFFPRFLMPEWLQTVSAYLPLTPVVDGVRFIVTEGKSLFDIAPQIGLLGLWAAVIYAVAFKVFRWE